MAAVKRYPCIFKHPMVREEVNPRLDTLGKSVPYGAFQRIWRQTHCPEVNPYGSEDCPYAAEDCVIAYWKTAGDALTQATSSPIGLFRILAKRRGYDRAERKPLSRDRDETRAGRSGDPSGQGLQGSRSRPTRIGDVLRTLDVGARQRSVDQGEESP